DRTWHLRPGDRGRVGPAREAAPRGGGRRGGLPRVPAPARGRPGLPDRAGPVAAFGACGALRRGLMAAPCLGPGLNRVLQGRGRRPAEQALLAPLEVERL